LVGEDPYYPKESDSAVSFIQVVDSSGVLLYIWAADDGVAGGVTGLAQGDTAGNAGVSWNQKMRLAKARDVSPMVAISEMLSAADSIEYYGHVDVEAGMQRLDSFEALKKLADSQPNSRARNPLPVNAARLRQRGGREREWGDISTADRVYASLLGGAIGDALGYPVEFWSADQIFVAEPGGVRRFLPTPDGSLGVVSDDTQMTLFTVEAIVAHLASGESSALLRDREAVAYLDWYDTQGHAWAGGSGGSGGSALRALPWLRVRRAPGMTVMGSLERAALTPSGVSVADAVNDSKGCGTVMRSAPFGLVMAWSPQTAYDHAAAASRVTHGHPAATVAAGTFAALIRYLLGGKSLIQSARLAQELAAKSDEAPEVGEVLDRAIAAYTTGKRTLEVVESLGEGWVAEEALAIAVYCALAYPSRQWVLDALSLAVSHGGDSDSTGAICGNLLGVMHGIEALPPELVSQVEGRETIAELATNLTRLQTGRVVH